MNKKLKTKPIKNEQVDTRVKFSSIAFAPTPSLLLHHRHGLLTGPPSRWNISYLLDQKFYGKFSLEKLSLYSLVPLLSGVAWWFGFTQFFASLSSWCIYVVEKWKMVTTFSSVFFSLFKCCFPCIFLAFPLQMSIVIYLPGDIPAACHSSPIRKVAKCQCNISTRISGDWKSYCWTRAMKVPGHRRKL